MGRIRLNVALTWTFAIAALGATACGSSTSNPVSPSTNPGSATAASLTVIVDPAFFGAGETSQARAFSGTVDVSTQTTWVSSNPAVAAVAPGGLVTALASGQAEIRGQRDGVSGVFAIQVISGADISDMFFAAAGSSTEVFLGQSFSLVPRIVINGGILHAVAASRVVWSTSDSRVVGVAPDGTVSTVSAGAANITATYLGKTASVRVTVTVLDHDTFIIASTGTSGQFVVGGRLSFSATIAYSLLSAPSGRIVLDLFDQNLRSLGANPTVDVTAGLFKTVTLTDEIIVPAGTTSICEAARLNLSSGRLLLSASGGCVTIR